MGILSSDVGKIVFHRRSITDVAMQELDLADIANFASPAEDRFDVIIFNGTTASEPMSVRFLLEELSKKVPASSLAKRISNYNNTKSISTWERQVRNIAKHRAPPSQAAWMYKPADWQEFLDSDVTKPTWPQKQQRPKESRGTPNQKAQANTRPCFTPAGGVCVGARVRVVSCDLICSSFIRSFFITTRCYRGPGVAGGAECRVAGEGSRGGAEGMGGEGAAGRGREEAGREAGGAGRGSEEAAGDAG